MLAKHVGEKFMYVGEKKIMLANNLCTLVKTRDVGEKFLYVREL